VAVCPLALLCPTLHAAAGGASPCRARTAPFLPVHFPGVGARWGAAGARGASAAEDDLGAFENEVCALRGGLRASVCVCVCAYARACPCPYATYACPAALC
jgi:hypothetical protein